MWNRDAKTSNVCMCTCVYVLLLYRFRRTMTWCGVVWLEWPFVRWRKPAAKMGSAQAKRIIWWFKIISQNSIINEWSYFKTMVLSFLTLNNHITHVITNTQTQYVETMHFRTNQKPFGQEQTDLYHTYTEEQEVAQHHHHPTTPKLKWRWIIC